MRRDMIAAMITVACFALFGGWLGVNIATALYVEPSEPKRYVELVGRQDCETRDWNCMTGANDGI